MKYMSGLFAIIFTVILSGCSLFDDTPKTTAFSDIDDAPITAVHDIVQYREMTYVASYTRDTGDPLSLADDKNGIALFTMNEMLWYLDFGGVTGTFQATVHDVLVHDDMIYVLVLYEASTTDLAELMLMSVDETGTVITTQSTSWGGSLHQSNYARPQLLEWGDALHVLYQQRSTEGDVTLHLDEYDAALDSVSTSAIPVDVDAMSLIDAYVVDDSVRLVYTFTDFDDDSTDYFTAVDEWNSTDSQLERLMTWNYVSYAADTVGGHLMTIDAYDDRLVLYDFDTLSEIASFAINENSNAAVQYLVSPNDTVYLFDGFLSQEDFADSKVLLLRPDEVELILHSMPLPIDGGYVHMVYRLEDGHDVVFYTDPDSNEGYLKLLFYAD